MSRFDFMYLNLCNRIFEQGTYGENRTGVPAYSLYGQQLKFDLDEEFPILTTKFVAFKHAVLEMFWIYQAASNDVRWLQERRVHIWDKWQIDENGMYKCKYYGKEYAGTIGTAYGYVVKKYDLMNRAIEAIRKNPTDRRIIVNLYQYDLLDGGVLPPCVYMHQWFVDKKKLNLVVYQRSCDVPIGFPFNVTQFALLANIVASITGYEVGKMYWNIGNAHIYKNQVEGVQKQLSRIVEERPAPGLWINPAKKEFSEFDNTLALSDIKLVNYKHLGKIKIPVNE